MNTYETFCEAPACKATVNYRATNFAAAIEHVRSLGWLAVARDANGYLSLCPAHKDGRTETMQRCSGCGKWCSRRTNVCPTCSGAPKAARKRGPKPRASFDGRTYICKSYNVQVPDFDAIGRFASHSWLIANTYPTGYSRITNPLAGFAGVITVG